MSGRGLPVGGCARSRYELGEIWSSGWGSSMVWEELLSSKGTWHSLMVGGAEWRGAGGGGAGAGGRRLEEAVEGGRGRPEEWTEKRRRQTCFDHVTWHMADINILQTTYEQFYNTQITLNHKAHRRVIYQCSHVIMHPLMWSIALEWQCLKSIWYVLQPILLP